MLAACALLAALGLALSGYWNRETPTQQTASYDVPLGVEEAVIIRYAGPRLIARPYRRGASVSVRIAHEAEQDGVRIYDVRYVVAMPGEFDVMDYLAAADGSELRQLPSFRVRGQTSMTKDIETRIREIEDVRVRIWHGYYETLVALGGVWLLWLGGLIWIGRPARAPAAEQSPPEPTPAEQIAALLAALARGELTVEGKARLELLLLCHWRERLAIGDERLAGACRRIAADARLGPVYRAMETWLHDPRSSAAAHEIVSLCAREIDSQKTSVSP